MARGRGVKDDDFVGHGLYLLEDFGERHGFVYAGDLSGVSVMGPVCRLL